MQAKPFFKGEYNKNIIGYVDSDDTGDKFYLTKFSGETCNNKIETFYKVCSDNIKVYNNGAKAYNQSLFFKTKFKKLNSGRFIGLNYVKEVYDGQHVMFCAYPNKNGKYGIKTRYEVYNINRAIKYIKSKL